MAPSFLWKPSARVSILGSAGPKVEMLGWMQGGYNVSPLVEALELDQDWGDDLMAVMEHDTAVQ